MIRRKRVDYEGVTFPTTRQVPGRPGLAVGEDGVVYGSTGRALKRHLSRGLLFLDVSGYPADDGGGWTPVDEIVCTAFHGPKPSPGHWCKNLSGDIYDNRPENVAWVLKRSAQQTEE